MPNLREIILGILMEITEEESYSHVVLRAVLEQYQYLDKRDRAFITRVTEGTLEHMLQLDYIIECFSKVPIYNMKPLIRNLLRMSVYQLKYMDSVPDSAVCNEAVRIAQKRGFYNLKGFVNGVLRNTARGLNSVVYPSAEEDPEKYLSVRYSMPMWIVHRWVEQYGFEITEAICADTHRTRPTTVRCRPDVASKEEIIAELTGQGIQVADHAYLDYALDISGYNYMQAVSAFRKGMIAVQDVSSMLVTEIAAPNWGNSCLDVCAAPGGKSLHLADKLQGSGYVEARDISERKVDVMRKMIDEGKIINLRTRVWDAATFDPAMEKQADIVLADVPCSGLGVIGRKQDVKYKMSEQKQTEIIRLQRKILHVVQNYVKPGGVLIYSTCTIGPEENQMNLKWFLDYFPFRLESIDDYLPKELCGRTTQGGYLQLLPGIHQSDGFFMARLRRLEEED